VDARSRGAKVRTLLERIGVEVDLRAPVGDLDPPHQRIVMLARALFSGARVLFLDEPTATLSTAEAEVLLRVVEAARDSGTSIVCPIASPR
jgi:ABC-type sugar transport system ATPase subunit